jgi:hypothetical protein
MGLSIFGLKDYSQRQGHLTLEQEQVTQAHFTEHSMRNADAVCTYILAEYGNSYSASGIAKLLRRLGFVYKKTQSLPAQADETRQVAIIVHCDALLTWLTADGSVASPFFLKCKHALSRCPDAIENAREGGEVGSGSRTPEPAGPWLVPQDTKGRAEDHIGTQAAQHPRHA